ncbi:DUF397 domain-containing protein [Spirillospora sp. NPDC050679]
MTPVWRKSSRSGSTSGQSDCVEVADLAGNIGVRDSKNPEGPSLLLDSAEWRAFTSGIKRGEHDLA